MTLASTIDALKDGTKSAINTAANLRLYHSETLSLTDDVATTATIDMRHWASVQILIPTSSPIEGITVYVCDTADGTFLPLNAILRDSSNDFEVKATVMVVEDGKAYDLPHELFSAHYVRLVVGSEDDDDIVAVYKS